MLDACPLLCDGFHWFCVAFQPSSACFCDQHDVAWLFCCACLPMLCLFLWPTWCVDSLLRCPCLMLQCMYLCYALLAWLIVLCVWISVVPVSVTNMMCRLFAEVPILLLQCMCIRNEAMMNASTQYISVRYISACLSFFGGLLFNSYQKCGCTNGVTDIKLAWA